jgi:hypothetical protein
MPDMLLHIDNNLPGISLIPEPIKLLRYHAEPYQEIVGLVLWLGFTTLFPPEPEQGLLIITHDDPGVRAADKGAAVLP